MSGQSFLRSGVTQDTPDPFPDEERRVFEMGLCGPGDDVNVVEAVEAGAAVGDQSRLIPSGNHLVGVAVRAG